MITVRTIQRRRVPDKSDSPDPTLGIRISDDPPRIDDGFERPGRLDVRRSGVALGTSTDVRSVRIVPPEPVDHDYIVIHLLTCRQMEARPGQCGGGTEIKRGCEFGCELMQTMSRGATAMYMNESCAWSAD